jgi:hypothetical protein
LFKLDESLKITDDNQLTRIKNKMDIIIASKKIKIFESYTDIYKKKQKILNDEKEQLKNSNKQIINEKERNEFILQEFKRNTGIGIIGLFTYMYFDKFSNFLRNTNSIKNYRQLFIFNFCFMPLIIGVYFSKLNYDNKCYEIKKNK